jgi:RNA polymerase sigma-70 factor (ECF subfamily)
MLMRAKRNEAFERIYAEHAQALFGFLRYRTGDRVLAEELLADTCERALRGLSRFDRRRGSEKTWLYTIALNCLHDHVRRRAVEGRALERVAADARPAGGWGELDEVAGRDIEEVVDRDLVHRCLGALSGEEREAIALRFGSDLSVPEIARLTRASTTTIEGRVYRALRKLRAELGLAVR